MTSYDPFGIMLFVQQFMQAPQTQLIFGMILLDFVLGVVAAIRIRTYQWARLAEFSYTNVLPYVLGYAALYTFAQFGVSALLTPQVGDISAVTFAAPMLAALAASIKKNLALLATVPEATPPTTE